jgi:hypothetical protein
MDVNTGFFICEMQFTPLSVMWRRDTTLASTASLLVGDPHIYPYVYPYFYQSEKKLYLNILNDGEKIGCKVTVTNNTEKPIETLEWVVTSGKNKQYARWLNGVSLAAGRTLEIDSNPSTQRAIVSYGDNEDDVGDYQEPNPQYINFVEIYSGNNQFAFNFDVIEGVQVDVSYTEQVRFI